MEKKKVLIVTQEMQPYTEQTIISDIARQLPQFIQEKGMEIRVLMPRYGTINERRHRLHEVVRLSGMNIIVNDDDYPLIIKVASLPKARMQVYFLDNEDFFKRKSMFVDENDEPFEDNPDRMVFFCKGVIETVKKFGWAPDIIYCNGWMTSLIPLYLRTAYKTEPLFQNSKIVYAVYDNSLEKSFGDQFIAKATINNLEEEDLFAFINGEGVVLHQGATNYADGIILNSEKISDGTRKSLKTEDKAILDYNYDPEKGIDFLPSFLEFFQSMLVTVED